MKRLMLLFALAGCGGPTAPESATQEVVTASRSHSTFVSFSNWQDTIHLDNGLERVGGACKITQPLVQDATTQWAPFQVYWVVRDNASDAGLVNMQVEHASVTPYFGWFDWVLDILSVRFATVRGT